MDASSPLEPSGAAAILARKATEDADPTDRANTTGWSVFGTRSRGAVSASALYALTGARGGAARPR
jgi:hypothetical protein